MPDENEIKQDKWVCRADETVALYLPLVIAHHISMILDHACYCEDCQVVVNLLRMGIIERKKEIENARR